MTVLKIVTEYLKANGYDGLYSIDGECGCKIGDLAPCGQMPTDCKAGFERPCPGFPQSQDETDEFGGCDCGSWHIGPWPKGDQR